MKTFQIADKLELPLDAVTERLGWLGQSGSGKTYGAMRLAELMLEAGAQVVAVDPVGVWKGLRTSADGKSAGFPVVVIGGDAGDVPITPTAGAMVADLLVDRGISAVIDVSDFTMGEQHTFMAAWSERLFDRQKRVKRPMHVFLEEAHTFLPQQLPPDPKAALMLHRMVRLVRVGRNHGMGCSIISQMPQAVSKQALNQVSCLFAMRTLGRNERKAIDEWFGDKAGDESELDMVKQLPKLETGEAIVASPSWLKGTKRVHITRKTTYDSSATPKFGQTLAAPKVLAPVDVEQLRVALADLVSQAEKDDPVLLRKRIAELERAGGKTVTKEVEKRVEVPVFTDRDRAEIAELRGKVGEILGLGGDLAGRVDQLMNKALAAKMPPGHAAERPRFVAMKFEVSQPLVKGSTPAIPGLKKGAREMLRELAALHPRSLTRRELATRVVMAHAGGSFGDYLSALRSNGLIEDDENGDLRATDVGVKTAGAVRAKSRDEIVALWAGSGRLKKGARAMLDALMQHGGALSREQLAEAAEMEVSGGSFGDYLSALRSSGCADESCRGSFVEGHALAMGEA